MTFARGRLACVLIFLGLGLGLLFTRLIDFQIEQAEKSRQAVALYTQAEKYDSPPRGLVYDTKGRLLVGNLPKTRVIAVPSKLSREPEDLKRISEVLKIPMGTLRQKLDDEKIPSGWPVVLRRSLKEGEVVKASILANGLEGLSLKSQDIRTYPYGKTASHILGYIGEISEDELKLDQFSSLSWGDTVGKRGIERSHDRLLRGTKGLSREWLDVLGRTKQESELRPREDGYDLQLTLDIELQAFAEALLAAKLKGLAYKNGETSGGAIVLMEAKTGRVISSVSLPEYDQRPFNRGITPSEFKKVLNQPGYPLINRVINGAYAPGSTFKVITASGALQEKLCHTRSAFWCSGSYLASNCFVRSGHGGIGFEGSIAHSCDVVYYQLGHKLGLERLHQYCAMYGLGSPTGIDLPNESGGLLPTDEWKQRYTGNEWWAGDTINMSIGQGFLLVSPLQMAVVTAAVANDGFVVEPYLLGRARDKRGALKYHRKYDSRREIKVDKKYLAAIRRGMEQAVLNGTSTAAWHPNFQVAGKTGTVENAPNRDNPHGRNHTWFVSYAPAKDPQVVCVVMLEQSGGYGGSQCAPLARQVLGRYFAGLAGAVK